MVEATRPRSSWTAAVLFVIALTGFLAGKNYVGAGDTLPAEFQPIALLKTGRLDFTALFPADDPRPYFLQRVSGRIVSVYPIVAGLLNVPVFAAARVVGYDMERHRLGLSLLSAAWIAAGSTLFLFLALDRVCKSRRTAVFFTLIYAFATEVFSVACRGLWQHGPSLLFINASLALLLLGGVRAVALSGITLGLAVAARPTNVLLALPLALWVARRERRSLAGFCACAALPALAVSLYSWAFLGSPFRMGQLQGLDGFQRRPSAEAMAGLLLSPSRGLFVFDPVFATALLLLVRPPADERVRSVLTHAAVFVPLLVSVVSFWRNWWGGHSFGYRLLTELVPLFVVAMAIAWEESVGRRPLSIALFSLLLALSAALHVRGAFVPTGFNYTPDNIDEHPERLWSVRDSEPARQWRLLLLSHR